LEEEQDEDTSSLSEFNELGIHLPNPNADKANAQQGKSLEVLLAIKNKRILEELTRFRVCRGDGMFLTPLTSRLQILHGELEASLQAAQEELVTVHSKLEKQQQLNEKLENDLLDVEKHQQAQTNGKQEARDSLKTTASSDALAGIELGKKPSVCIS
jgi:homeobox protein cut-like